MTNSNSTVHHLLILDAFCKNDNQKSLVLSQVNDSIDAIRNSDTNDLTTEHRITLFVSSQNGISCKFFDLNVYDVGQIDLPNKTVQATNLLDAIGGSIGTWRAMRKSKNIHNSYRVSIFTTGRDNASKKYSRCTLKMIIESLRKSGWTFIMIGAHPLLPRIAQQIGITHYYIKKDPFFQSERNFLISQLKRQWKVQNTHLPQAQNDQMAA